MAVLGLNVSGAEQTNGTDSNLPGTYGTDYAYEPAASYTYLAGRGCTFYRIGVRWKRLQPTVLTALDATEAGRLTGQLNDAATAGAVRLVVDVHDFGRRDGNYAGLPIGSAGGPTLAAYVDFQTRLGALLAGFAAAHPAVSVELDHTNEPHDMAPVGGTFTAAVTRYSWEPTSGGFGAAPFGISPFGA